MRRYRFHPGWRYPAGAKKSARGVNFSLFSQHATGIELLLYERADSPEPFQVIRLDPEINRTFFFWHVFIDELPAGVHYTWRVDGPDDPCRSGFRFNREIELLDPAARAVTTVLWDRRSALEKQRRKESAPSMRAMVADLAYDWDGDQPINHSPEGTVIYEVHAGGFTRHFSSGVTHPGTFTGLIEKIPYLKELGITDIELLPVMAFDEQEVPEGTARRGLTNYWGYSTHSFFSPHPGYCVTPTEGTHVVEFRNMVKALHKAGIGVILDVVFNHTAEGGANGLTMNFKGTDNSTFYHLDPLDKCLYRDYTGCGNTVNCNHPLTSRFILNCLEYWVREMHVDGFRFDLASAMARGEDGNPMRHAPVLWNIEFSDILAHTRIIAEAWDAAGLYQVGDFPGFRWMEWNGRYRDTVKRFVRGDKGMLSQLANALSGSSDLYQAQGRLPINSINYVTCHDGFTLYDQVSYTRKYNEMNGEENRDGSDENLSWNCGAEGETSDPEILFLRRRQARNFMAILLLSQGIPMILAGDEVLRTQRGNNNCYCQNNEMSWFDWSLTERNHDMVRFVRQMIAFRKRHPCLMRIRFFTGRQREGRLFPDIAWHGIRLNEPHWGDPDAQVLSYTIGAVEEDEEDLHVMLNMTERPAAIQLPHLLGRKWHRAIDTGQPSPADIIEPYEQPPVRKFNYLVLPRSVVVLESR
ncbi:MAG: glycogen debranching protein GlgX [Alphaproteobacteria bacterium]|uniref:Glycogen debranching protein GlgX n=1 Tax=Candidatus Nitrobium versatile TaxID=2884831 RepID=A0A953M340_9BACT|nr:glycogen debranching protein GlgX [Candidatus Nitrobium versatile]